MKKSVQVTLLSALACCCCAQPALASTFSLSGDTTGDPTYNRPVVSPQFATVVPTTLSGVGTAVPFESLAFNVAVTGQYRFLSIQNGFDGILFLYQTSFNAAAPLTNVLFGNDDLLGADASLDASGFDANLTAGTQYFLVTTGFENSDFGSYTNTVRAIPEPATVFGMLTLGLLATQRKLGRRS